MSPEVVANNTRVTSRRSSNGRAVVHERYIGDERILAVGDTFFVKVTKSEPVCIGQLILLWHDDANSEDLASLRLYYLPDAIPSGRQLEHGRVSSILYLSWTGPVSTRYTCTVCIN